MAGPSMLCAAFVPLVTHIDVPKNGDWDGPVQQTSSLIYEIKTDPLGLPFGIRLCRRLATITRGERLALSLWRRGR
jgi:hypothetical protein